jgi:hypothetical protein
VFKGLTNNLDSIGKFNTITSSGITVEINTDRPGGDYLTTPLPALADCQKMCLADIKCRAYTFLTPGANPENWHGPSPPHCWLKNTQPAPTVYKGFVSGIRTGR